MTSRTINKIEEIFESVKTAGRNTLTAHECRIVCEAYGIEVSREDIAETADHAEWLASTMGFPVAMKVVSPDISDQKKVGGIIVGVKGPKRAYQAFDRIIENVRRREPYADVIGVMVKKMVKDGHAFTVRAIRDDGGSKLVAVSMHHSTMERVGDIAFHKAPATREDALSMINEILSSRRDDSTKNEVAVNRDGLANLIVIVSQMISDLCEISEIDLNPVYLTDNGVFAFDVRIAISNTVESNVPSSLQAE